MQNTGYTSRAAWIVAAIHALTAAGFDARQQFVERGIDIDGIDLQNGRASVEIIAAVWQLTAELTADAAIGVRSALTVFNPAQWQSLGLAVLCSNDLQDALLRLTRFQHPMITDAAVFQLKQSVDYCALEISLSADAELLSFEAQEFGVTATLTMLRSICAGMPEPVRRIKFTRPAAQANADFASLLGCELEFGHRCLVIEFDPAQLNQPLPGANAALAAYQDRYSRDYISRYGAGSLVLSVRQAMLRELAGGNPSHEQIADSLHMGTRSLQRRLEQSGTSFSQLLRELRMELAQDYLIDKRNSLAEVAYLLGFSDQSNLTRAFKSWFGLTPTQYRQQQR